MRRQRSAGRTISTEFRKRRARQLAVAGVGCGVLVVIFVASRGQEMGDATPPAFVALAVVIAVAIAAFSLLNWRCPACRAYLGKGIAPSFCRSCGARLEDPYA